MEKENCNGINIVIFGGTGDLAKKKLAPAFADLISEGVLTKDSTLIGIARHEFSDESYRDLLVSSISDKKEKDHLKNIKVKFIQGDFNKEDTFRKLKLILGDTSVKSTCGVIYYLATGFKLFPDIVAGLKKNNLNKFNNGFVRIVFEKPFGDDLKSCEKIEKEIHKVFGEDQIFRIDHYLGKRAIINLNILKFTNPIIWNSFNNKMIEKIEVTVDEDVGVGDRIGFYEGVGALKDMIQSHMLQILSILLMEKPKELTPRFIHHEKIKVMKNLRVLSAENHILGQYKSYEKEALAYGVKNSKTETYARILLECSNKRWKGVKLVLRTGKKLSSRYGRIDIYLKNNNFKTGLSGIDQNKIRIDIQPEQDIKIILNGSKFDSYTSVAPTWLYLSHISKANFGPNTPDAYKRLIQDVILNDNQRFTRYNELKEAWKIVDKIESMKDKIRFVIYEDNKDPEKII